MDQCGSLAAFETFETTRLDSTGCQSSQLAWHSLVSGCLSSTPAAQLSMLTSRTDRASVSLEPRQASRPVKVAQRRPTIKLTVSRFEPTLRKTRPEDDGASERSTTTTTTI